MLHNCDLCGNSADFLPLPGDPSGKISICGQCGFVLVRERRSVAEIALAWNAIYASGGYDPNWPGVKARLYYVAEWIRQNIGLDGKAVLDIGAGGGQFLRFCRGAGAHPVGLDPSPSNVHAIRSHDIACFQGFASDDAPPIGQYDIVTLNWTLENTGDALAILRYAKRCLAPGGHVVVATGSRILVPFKKPLSSYLPQDVNYPHDTHCYRWSYESLGDAFEKIGMLNMAPNVNDFEQRDEMIVAFSVVSGGPLTMKGLAWPRHAPFEVRDYFKRWETCFP